jgi:coenzyme F420 hydrogenase subunit beta
MADVPDHGLRPIPRGPLENTPSHELAVAVCPGRSLSHERSAPLPEEIPELFDVWGPCREVWEGHAVDAEIRLAGSSGGAATALAAYAIETGVAGGVMHTAATPEHPLENQTVISRNRDELLVRAGSRYAPASPCDRLDLLTEEERPLVFIGKPCDVAGLSQLCRKRADVREKIGLTIAVYCAGTPSSAGTRKLLEHMGVRDARNVISIRYRGQGWPGEAVVEERLPGGEIAEYHMSYAESWGMLTKFRQWRCLICPDHTGEFADISVGDPWYRETSPDEPGLSLIMARTARGVEFLHAAIAAGYLSASQADPRIVPASQEHLLRVRGELWGRLFALRMRLIPIPRYRNFRLFRNWLRGISWKQKIRSIASTMARIKRRSLHRRVPMIAPADETTSTRATPSA